MTVTFLCPEAPTLRVLDPFVPGASYIESVLPTISLSLENTRVLLELLGMPPLSIQGVLATSELASLQAAVDHALSEPKRRAEVLAPVAVERVVGEPAPVEAQQPSLGELLRRKLGGPEAPSSVERLAAQRDEYFESLLWRLKELTTSAQLNDWSVAWG